MKAVLLYAYGDPAQLRYEETDMPKYGDNEVLVKVRATSINPIDLKIRSGAAKSRMPLEFPAILGRDLSGEVAETGRNVTGFPKGMRVMALANRTYAEYTVAKADVLAPIPDALNFEQAGSTSASHHHGLSIDRTSRQAQSGSDRTRHRGIGRRRANSRACRSQARSACIGRECGQRRKKKQRS
jgi:hypothetical protein